MICNTPRQTQCVRNSIFLLFVMVIACCGPSCGLWLCVGALNRGCAKNYSENYFAVGIICSSGNITHRPDNYSIYFLVFLTYAGLWPRVLRYNDKIHRYIHLLGLFVEYFGRAPTFSKMRWASQSSTITRKFGNTPKIILLPLFSQYPVSSRWADISTS